MKILIKNAKVISPKDNLDDVLDILIEGSVIKDIRKDINLNVDKLIDAKDKIVMPAIVDMHVHLREPGREDKETIASGTMAAVHGGVGSLLSMPNTLATIDCVENVRLLKEIISKNAKANVFICGAITKSRLGKELTDIEALKEEGVIAISDDGNSVDNEELLLEALKITKRLKIITIEHCEDKSISKDGVMNLSFVSTCLGLKGMPREAEYKRVKRNIELASKVDAPIHITHVSCLESVEIIREAKKRGLKVTADTAPHYFSLTEEAVRTYDSNFKMNPPLRTEADVLAIKEALADGTIDAIISDHAPHTENEKEIEFDKAEFGIIGLETELAVAITELLDKKILSFNELVKKFTENPARILNIDKGSLGINKTADLIIVDPNKEWVVKKGFFFSKSKNSPFIGRTLKGIVNCTIISGEIVYSDFD